MHRKFTEAMNAPAHLVAGLRCDVCRNYLSVGPVGRLGSAASCGRCDTGWPRNVEYEALARLFTFPCLYCGDSARLGWGDVERHEARCVRDVVFCPARREIVSKATPIARVPRPTAEYHPECQATSLRCPFDGCDSTYETRRVAQHFARHHADHLLETRDSVRARKRMKAEKAWDFTGDSHVCLVSFRSELPLLLFVHSSCSHDDASGDIRSYSYSFGVFTLCADARGSRLRYDVTVRLESEDGGVATLASRGRMIESFDQRLHRVAYLRAGLADYFGFAATKFPDLPRSPDLSLSYEIRFVVDDDADTAAQLSVATRCFECPICQAYMAAPVYNCATGHSFCAACSARLTECPYCRAPVGHSRNYALEEVLETARAPCQNGGRGCRFVGTVREIERHEPQCEYGTR